MSAILETPHRLSVLDQARSAALTRNPRFAREFAAKVEKARVVLPLCRSGKRSALAAGATAKAGFTNVFNVIEGFAGELDAKLHRGRADGWRFHASPWMQD